jgi:ATP-binding cassette subfamily B protein
MLLSTACLRTIPWLLKIAIDGFKGQTLGSELRWLILAMVAAAAVGAFFLYAQRWLLIGTSRRIEYDLRNQLFSHVQRLDLGFFGQKPTGDLLSHFTNDLNALRDVAGPGIMYAGSMSTALVTSLALMIALDPLLTLVAFAPYPFITWVTVRFGREMHKRSRRVQDLFGTISSRVQEDLSGVRVIRAFGRAESCRERFRDLSSSYFAANMSVARLRGGFFAAMSALAGSGLAIALLIGGGQVIRGTLSLGSLVAFTAYLSELIWPVIAVGFVIGTLQRGASAAARLNGVLSRSSAISPGTLKRRPVPRIRFESVSFRYPSAEHDSLSDISFHVEPGEMIGIVGRTGAGKSTVLKLLLRFYDPSGGRVVLDDADLRDYDISVIREIISYAPQDSFLFSRSVGKNIAYGAPSASDVEVQRVAGRAQLTDEVERFPKGFNTLVGERGITLSGGQRQRVSMARALLRQSDLLVLDDTLSSVDAEMETRILRELVEYRRDRTAMIVSHRTSAVQDADRILVLDAGRVVEEGTHEALIERGGLYARIHERQRLSDALEDSA